MCSNKVESLLKRESERQQIIIKKKTEKKLETPENEQYSYFNDVFDEKYKEIETLLEQTASLSKNEMIMQFDKMSKKLNALKKFMSDSLIFLRGYDVRICNEHLQDLELKIKKTEDTLLPKKKFGFKNKKAPKESISSDIVDSSNGSEKYKIFEENFFGFKDFNGQKLTLDRNNLYKKDVSLHNLTNCTVLLSGIPSTLQLSSLNNCLIICGPVCTSIFAENCLDCKFVIACQQLRLHSSVNCTIYLHVTSKAIIEDCREIKAAPYNYQYDNMLADFEEAGLNPTINHWDSFDDFNWLVADKKSPNWSILGESSRITDWTDTLEAAEV